MNAVHLFNLVVRVSQWQIIRDVGLIEYEATLEYQDPKTTVLDGGRPIHDSPSECMEYAASCIR